MDRVNALPLVGAEVQRINAAFAAVSSELAGVLSGLRDVDLSGVGTPSADAAVEAGMADLGAALSRLLATSEECTVALRRHGVLDDETDPAVLPDEGDPL
jgi:hypothetical protein